MKALFRFDVICDESKIQKTIAVSKDCLLYTSPSPRDTT